MNNTQSIDVPHRWWVMVVLGFLSLFSRTAQQAYAYCDTNCKAYVMRELNNRRQAELQVLNLSQSSELYQEKFADIVSKYPVLYQAEAIAGILTNAFRALFDPDVLFEHRDELVHLIGATCYLGTMESGEDVSAVQGLRQARTLGDIAQWCAYCELLDLPAYRRRILQKHTQEQLDAFLQTPLHQTHVIMMHPIALETMDHFQ